MKVISFKPGELLSSEGGSYLFVAPLDAYSVIARSQSDGRNHVLKIAHLRPIDEESAKEQEISQIDEEDWKVAKRRYAAIQPLLSHKEPEPAAYERQAAKYRVHFVTLYRWRSKFLRTGTLNSLLPTKRGPKRGLTKLDHEVEHVLKSLIQEFYLTAQKPSVAKVTEELAIACREKGLIVPHYNTVRNRIARLHKADVLRGHEGASRAAGAFSVNKGSVTADFPLAVVQIDHTLLDVILVDDDSRLPIGRPWITVAFDVNTRIVLSFYLSLDPPGALSAGLCLSRAILKKDSWLGKLGLSLQWPYWGIPVCIHMDNGKEFRGEMLKRVCEQYGIETHWRPVARPNWGGHIERYMLTFARELKALPGATFSNPEERGGYNSDATAALTISELERYLAIFIAEKYHRKVHSGIGQTPAAAWEEGIFGSRTKTGTGLPRMVADEDRFCLDFLPFEERTINDYGVVIDGIHYYSDVLRPYVNSRNPDRYHTRRMFLFRRDPRDISQIFFWDEDNGRYHSIPYRNTGRPPISLWELRAAKRYLKERAESQEDEDAIFRTLVTLRSLVTTSVTATRRKRRDSQRKKAHAELRSTRVPKEQSPPPVDTAEDLSAFTAFEEIDIS